MQVVVLAGGLATRMRPLTDRIPKSLLPVAGRPFLEWQLECLARNGAGEVLLCTGHLGELIDRHLREWRAPIPTSTTGDGTALVGTGGAVVLAARRGLLRPTFLVTYGDSYLPVPLAPLATHHEAAGLPATLAVLRNQDRWGPSNTVVEGDRVIRHEKLADPARRPPGMDFIDYGLSVFDRAEVERWSDALPLDLSAVMGRLASRGSLTAHEVHERFYEIGSGAGMGDLERRLRGEDA